MAPAANRKRRPIILHNIKKLIEREISQFVIKKIGYRFLCIFYELKFNVLIKNVSLIPTKILFQFIQIKLVTSEELFELVTVTATKP